jgi:hypothetical protein
MHALLEPGIAGARGIEIDRIKCDKAAAFLRQAVAELRRRGAAGDALVPPPVECSAIEKVGFGAGSGFAVPWCSAAGRTAAASQPVPCTLLPPPAPCWHPTPHLFPCRHPASTCSLLAPVPAAGALPGPLHPCLLFLGGRPAGGQGRLWPPVCGVAQPARRGGGAARGAHLPPGLHGGPGVRGAATGGLLPGQHVW